MRIFTAGLLIEVNSFSPIPANTAYFEQDGFIHRHGQHGEHPFYYAKPLVKVKELADAQGIECIEGLCAAASPAGLVIKHTYEAFRDEIMADLQAALPVDGIFLNLHGAMIAHGYPDCEGDLLAHLRKIVGAEIPIAVELDPHTNLTQTMLDNATLMVWQKEYPHTDYNERAEELFDLLVRCMQGKIQPTKATVNCQMIDMFATTLEPMKSLVDEIKTLEQATPDLLNISIVHGFPWCDVPEVGAHVVVTTDNNPALAQHIAEEINTKLQALKGQTFPKAFSIDGALDQALNLDSQPIVLADFTDNTGGGAPGDSTFILRRVFERHLQNVALSPLYDPMAVTLATAAGVGTTLPLRIGGKMAKTSGQPLDLVVTVTHVTERLTTEVWGMTVDYGPAVAVHCKGVDIVLCSIRSQTFAPDAFSNMGIGPLNKNILIVKSSEHYRAEFSKITDHIFTVDVPEGTLTCDFASIPYRHKDA